MILVSSVLIALLVGWYAREILERLKELKVQVTALVKRDIPVEEPRKSSIIEMPMTPSERIQRDQQDLIDRLNP